MSAVCFGYSSGFVLDTAFRVMDLRFMTESVTTSPNWFSLIVRRCRDFYLFSRLTGAVSLRYFQLSSLVRSTLDGILEPCLISLLGNRKVGFLLERVLKGSLCCCNRRDPIELSLLADFLIF